MTDIVTRLRAEFRFPSYSPRYYLTDAADYIEKLRSVCRMQNAALINIDPYIQKELSNDAISAYKELNLGE
jgi:thymidine kinase